MCSFQMIAITQSQLIVTMSEGRWTTATSSKLSSVLVFSVTLFKILSANQNLKPCVGQHDRAMKTHPCAHLSVVS